MIGAELFSDSVRVFLATKVIGIKIRFLIPLKNPYFLISTLVALKFPIKRALRNNHDRG
jgi:hypothetical protein